MVVDDFVSVCDSQPFAVKPFYFPVLLSTGSFRKIFVVRAGILKQPANLEHL
jgi:hypothetical protein